MTLFPSRAAEQSVALFGLGKDVTIHENTEY